MGRIVKFPEVIYPTDSSRPPVIAFAALVFGGFLGVMLILRWFGGINPPVTGFSLFSTATPFLPNHPTPTPFQPVPIEPTPRFIESPITIPFFSEMDLKDGAGIVEMVFHPSQPGFNNGDPLSTRFYPGSTCNFGDQKACVSLHEDGLYLLLTLHSGVGGEGQALRHGIEGTGINRAGKGLADTLALLELMKGTEIVLSQGSFSRSDLVVRATLRIPASGLADYFSRPFTDALYQAAEKNDDLQGLLKSGEPIIFIETCGWRMAEEPWVQGVYDTTSSIYILAITTRE